MDKQDLIIFSREIDDATHMLPDRDRAIFMLGYRLAAKQAQRAMQATMTTLKNSVPGITSKPGRG